jgi:hypothetical protein
LIVAFRVGTGEVVNQKLHTPPDPVAFTVVGDGLQAAEHGPVIEPEPVTARNIRKVDTHHEVRLREAGVFPLER